MPTSMGKDLKITYKISPSPFTADTAVLEVKDKNGVVVYTDNTIPKSDGTHTATWLVSTASLRSVNSEKGPYEVKITITKGAASDDDTEPLDVEPSSAVVVAEKSVTTGSPITECMERRWVTFTATARGFVSEDNSAALLPTSADRTILFTFYYEKANGTLWTETDWSFDLVEDNTQEADQVPATAAGHFFETPIYVAVTDDYTHHASSSKIKINVYELWIDYFRDAATSKPWKVAVGDEIAYKAISSSDCKNWAWDMNDGWPTSAWNPTGGNAKEGTTGSNPMKIPKSDLTRAANDWFGKEYGTVDVFCEDEEGNNHYFYSTSMTPSQKAEVFFSGPATTHPGGGSKNWFYYWKYSLFGNIKKVKWDATVMYGASGSSGVVTIGDKGNADYATPYNHTALFGYPRPTADGKTLIDLFYTVLTHELQHRADWPLYDTGVDSDGDHLPDSADPFPLVMNGAGYAEYTGAKEWVGDWEYKARGVENVIAPAKKDWSKGGKQW